MAAIHRAVAIKSDGSRPSAAAVADGRGGRGGAKPSREGPPSASAPPIPCGMPLEIYH
jgi:hypothetical protein